MDEYLAYLLVWTETFDSLIIDKFGIDGVIAHEYVLFERAYDTAKKNNARLIGYCVCGSDAECVDIAECLRGNVDGKEN